MTIKNITGKSFSSSNSVKIYNLFYKFVLVHNSFAFAFPYFYLSQFTCQKMCSKLCKSFLMPSFSQLQAVDNEHLRIKGLRPKDIPKLLL